MKRLSGFLRDYKLFSLALSASVLGVALQLEGAHSALKWILEAVAVIELLPILVEMWRDIRAGKYGLDILAVIAIVSSVILGQYWAAIVIVLMFTGGQSLERYAERRARSELSSLLEHAPRTAHLLRKGKTQEVAVKELYAGDKIIIKAGEVVPVDAVVIDGAADFDESSLTGESLPRPKQTGDTLLSGSINLDGSVTAKALASAADSQYQQIIKLVRGASAHQAPFVRLADRYSLPFTLAACAIAGMVWVLSGQAIRFLEIIVVATPCPLLLAAPVALMSGMSRASRYGIIVKSGAGLEKLGEARTFAFDKTGTLTKGTPQVANVTAYAPFTETEVLILAASLEQSSNHILAQAIIRNAREQNLKLGKARHVQEFTGRGLRATLQGKVVLVGRPALLEDEGVTFPAKYHAKAAAQTTVAVAVDGRLAGFLQLRDELRPQSEALMLTLKRGGVKDIILVTGDSRSTADGIARELGIK